MKFDKCFILIIFLMLILSVSAVNAADDFNNGDNSINSGEAISPASTTVNKNWTVDDFLNNYTTIQDNDVVLIRNGTGTPSGNVVLSQNGITIFTEGNVVFDGKNKNMHFEITGSNVLIKGITFKSFNFYGKGGAILWTGDNGTLSDCDFNSNKATSNDIRSFTVSSSFRYDAKSSVYGGAVYWGGSNGNINSCNFTNNTALSNSESSIHCSVPSGAPTFMASSISRSYGGAIYWGGINGILTDCNFDGNTAISNSESSIYSSSIMSSDNSSSWSYSYGGAVYWTGANGNLTNCNFTDNAARSNSESYIGSSFTVSSSWSYSYGGAVYWGGVNGSLTDCNINDNIAYTTSYSASGDKNGYREYTNSYSYGGAVYWGGVNGSLTGCNSTGNSAFSNARSAHSTGSSRSYGGAVYWNGDNGNLESSTFINNTANYGGAIYWFVAGSIVNCSFVNSEWVKSNGIYASKDLTINGGNGIVDLIISGKLSGISIIVLNNETYQISPNQEINITGRIMSGNLTIVADGFKFKMNGTQINSNPTISSNGEYYVTYTSNIPTNLVISADYAKSGANTKYKNGTLIFKNMLNPDMNVSVGNVSYGDDATVTVSLNAKATGSVTIIVDGKTKIVNIVNGKAEWTITGLAAGTYTVTVSYNGDNNFTQDTANTKFTVSKISPDMNVSVGNVSYGDDATVTVSLNAKATGSVTIIVDGKTKIVNIVNGKAEWTITGLAAGTYTVTVSYNGDNNFTQDTANTKFTVSSGYVLEAEDVVKYFRNGTQYHVSLKDIAGNPVAGEKIIVTFVSSKGGNPSQYTIITNANGIATLVINANPAVYYITATYGNQSVSNKITVLKLGYSISAEDVIMGFKDGTQYTVKVVDTQGNPVTGVKVSVTIYSSKWSKPATYNIVTDSNGIAKLSIGLAIGQYTFTAKYGSEAVTTNVAVLSGSYRLIAGDVIKYFKNGTQYTVKVTNLKGNPIAGQKVVVDLYSRTGSKMASYTITTNNNGIATLTINLIPNQYTIKASIGSDSVQNTITVLPTLTAETLTKPVNQQGSLVAKLVDGQGKPLSGKSITFTIKSKTYTKTTNANGLASLPIGLGVGTWTIDIADPSTGVKTTARVVITKARA